MREISEFLPRLIFADVMKYTGAAWRDEIRVGQWVEVEGVPARYGGRNGAHLTTWWHSTSTRTPQARRAFAKVAAEHRRRRA